jgi:hypothetical protein
MKTSLAASLLVIIVSINSKPSLAVTPVYSVQ